MSFGQMAFDQKTWNLSMNRKNGWVSTNGLAIKIMKGETLALKNECKVL
jgi:hypothetical protein